MKERDKYDQVSDGLNASLLRIMANIVSNPAFVNYSPTAAELLKRHGQQAGAGLRGRRPRARAFASAAQRPRHDDRTGAASLCLATPD